MIQHILVHPPAPRRGRQAVIVTRPSPHPVNENGNENGQRGENTTRPPLSLPFSFTEMDGNEHSRIPMLGTSLMAFVQRLELSPAPHHRFVFNFPTLQPSSEMLPATTNQHQYQNHTIIILRSDFCPQKTAVRASQRA